MSEQDAVKQTPDMPATVDSLVADLQSLGITEGSVVLVHASLSRLGWVCGGAVAVIQALHRAVGSNGTIVMPAHSTDLSDPSGWSNPPVPEAWWSIIRNTMPAFDPATTPTRGMGRIAELFRTWPRVLRSEHPKYSFAASGPAASEIISDHALDCGLGEDSPLGRLYDMEARVLLLAVGHSGNTSLHLSETRAAAGKSARIKAGTPMIVDGMHRWVELTETDYDNTEFAQIGASFAEDTGLIQTGLVARGHSLLMPQHELVDFGTHWLKMKHDSHSAGD